MDLWLNIESGFEGDINLALGGSAITNDAAEQQVRIATAINPVTVKVDVENVRIGYQFVPVGDFSITEKIPGALLANEQVYISVTDNMSSDMHIASGFDYDVTKGDLRIRNMRTGTNLGLNNNNNNNANVSFEIDRASSEASEITFSNVQVRLSGNAPISNEGANGQGYDLVAWGPAIAANFEGVRPNTNNNDDNENEINRNDFFREPGIRAKFVNIQNTVNNALTNVVRATSGSPTIMVNDRQMVMDTAPYISPASDSMMVPVRFISMGLGVDADRVLWSPDTSTVTIDAGERILQFQTNSSMMRINGIEVPMLNAAGNPVYSEVRDERAFIPFRALGNALNVHVDWDPSTATATFDPTKPATRGAGITDSDIAMYGNYNEGNNTDINANVNGNTNNNGNTNDNTRTNNGTDNYAEGYQNGNSQQNRTLVSGMQLNNALQSTTPNSVMQVQNRGLMNRPGYVQMAPMQIQTANR